MNEPLLLQKKDVLKQVIMGVDVYKTSSLTSRINCHSKLAKLISNFFMTISHLIFNFTPHQAFSLISVNAMLSAYSLALLGRSFDQCMFYYFNGLPDLPVLCHLGKVTFFTPQFPHPQRKTTAAVLTMK